MSGPSENKGSDFRTQQLHGNAPEESRPAGRFLSSLAAMRQTAEGAVITGANTWALLAAAGPETALVWGAALAVASLTPKAPQAPLPPRPGR